MIKMEDKHATIKSARDKSNLLANFKNRNKLPSQVLENTLSMQDMASNKGTAVYKVYMNTNSSFVQPGLISQNKATIAEYKDRMLN